VFQPELVQNRNARALRPCFLLVAYIGPVAISPHGAVFFFILARLAILARIVKSWQAEPFARVPVVWPVMVAFQGRVVTSLSGHVGRLGPCDCFCLPYGHSSGQRHFCSSFAVPTRKETRPPTGRVLFYVNRAFDGQMALLCGQAKACRRKGKPRSPGATRGVWSQEASASGTHWWARAHEPGHARPKRPLSLDSSAGNGGRESMATIVESCHCSVRYL
jgi:hypothetical protein